MIYTLSNDVRQIGEKILKEPRYKYIVDASIQIGYMETDKERQGKKIRYADCTKVADRYRALSPYDFLITFYPPALEASVEAQERIMRHELLHVGVKPDGSLYVEPHDVEDFREMLEQYGLDWVRE